MATQNPSFTPDDDRPHPTTRPSPVRARAAFESGRRLRRRLAVVLLLVVAYASSARAQPGGSFTAAGDMGVPRFGHSATLLRDGRVLIAGGRNRTSDYASAELYDSSGGFVATGSMTVGRSLHTATLLADGRVLIAGGFNSRQGNATLGSAELYDPSSGTFTVTGSMRTARYGHQAVLLADGRVLIVGSSSEGWPDWLPADVSAEVYDPYTGTFSPAGTMREPGAASATLLANGTVLITRCCFDVGDGDPDSVAATVQHADIYNPADGTFSATGDLVIDRDDGAAEAGDPTPTLLSNGKVLFTGNGGDPPSSTAALYDPDLGVFTRTGDLLTPRLGHTATLLSDGTVLIAGGRFLVREVPGSDVDNLSSTELYDPISGTFRPGPSMTTGRYLHQATLLPSGQVLIEGGLEGTGGPRRSGLTSSAELYTPAVIPYHGTPVTLPGVVQAEEFVDGPDGVAYHDVSAGNSGGVYRATDVDLEPTSDDGGGYDVGWVSAGEWLNYAVNVASAGDYTVQLRVASPGGGVLHVGFNGTPNVWTPVDIPATGGWQQWTTVALPVALGSGPQLLTLVFDTDGFNVNYIEVTANAARASSPYHGTPVMLPGVVQAEEFDNGRDGIAYHDESPGNSGGGYRATDADIEATTDDGGGYDVGWVSAGEWMNYSVNVASAGEYTVQLRVASPGGGVLHVGFNGTPNVWTAVDIPATGGWQQWTTVALPVALGSGPQLITLVFDTDGFNVNYFEVTAN